MSYRIVSRDKQIFPDVGCWLRVDEGCERSWSIDRNVWRTSDSKHRTPTLSVLLHAVCQASALLQVGWRMAQGAEQKEQNRSQRLVYCNLPSHIIGTVNWRSVIS